jgi:hypothetical protein
MSRRRPANSVATSSTVPFLGAFESTFLPAHDVDVVETTGHDRQWESDIDLDVPTTGALS